MKRYLTPIFIIMAVTGVSVFICDTGMTWGYTQYIFENTTYDKVWDCCLILRDKNDYSHDGKSYGAGKLRFEAKADKEEGVIAFYSNNVIIAANWNTIKIKGLRKDKVKVTIRSRYNDFLSNKRDVKEEKRLLTQLKEMMHKNKD